MKQTHLQSIATELVERINEKNRDIFKAVRQALETSPGLTKTVEAITRSYDERQAAMLASMSQTNWSHLNYNKNNLITETTPIRQIGFIRK